MRSTAEYNTAGTRIRYTEYARDDLLQLQHIDAPEGFIDLTYDAAGRLTEYTDTGGTIRYAYNTSDDLIALAEPGGDCAGQTYDAPGAAAARCILFRVDDEGNRTGIRYPGGASQTWELDATGRTTRTVGTAAGGNKLDLAYAYNDPTAAVAGNPVKDTGVITAITDAVADRKTTYTYDALDRLTTADTRAISGGWTADYEAFCYDAASNRTKYFTLPGATCADTSPAIAATYDGANQMTAATGNGPTGALTGTGFSYDGNGNQTAAKSIPGHTSTYNDRDQATTTPTGSSPATATYAGGGNANRLTAGSSSYQATPLAPAPGRSTTGSTTTWAVRDPDGHLVAIRQGPTPAPASATTYYPFTDQVDSVRTLVTATGAVAATYAYSAYGLTRTTTGTLSQPYQYGGGHTDATTGLIKLGIRYYDPTHGRFT